MTVRELIQKLHDVDPTGDREVRMYVHRRWGGDTREVGGVRKFMTSGAVMIGDVKDDES